MEWCSKCDKDVPMFSLDGETFECKLVDAYDADTCRVIFHMNGRLVKFTIRLTGIDTPEMRPPRSRPNRDAEKRAAHRARNFLVSLACNCDIDIDKVYKKRSISRILDKNTKIISLECGKFDKYGRLLGKLRLGESTANDELIKAGYANAYDGGTKQGFNF